MMKPLDFGGGGVNGSVDTQGRMIALNFYHHVYGYVTLTTAEPFPEDQRYVPAAVRAYRSSLAALTGFGVYFNLQEIESAESRMLENAIPQVRLALSDGGSALVTTWAERGGAVQRWAIKGAQARWGGKVALQRCAYTQLTEGGPLTPPPVQMRVYEQNGLLILANPAMGSAVAVAGLKPSAGLDINGEGLVSVGIPAPESGEFTLAYGVGSSVEEAVGNARALSGATAKTISLKPQATSHKEEQKTDTPRVVPTSASGGGRSATVLLDPHPVRPDVGTPSPAGGRGEESGDVANSGQSLPSDPLALAMQIGESIPQTREADKAGVVPTDSPEVSAVVDSVGAVEVALSGVEGQKLLWRKRWEGVPDEPLVRRALVYGLSMCIPVNLGVCILTDHMLLPLSWNRDAYYVALALLKWRREAADLVRQHLVWLFEIAERPNNAWGRCYLANGKVKDPAYQFDQQLYPILELVDYTITTGDARLMAGYLPQVTEIIDTILKGKADFAPLFPTDETPADDPIPQPYHLSSHILLWHTLNQLRKLGVTQYSSLADELEKAIPEYFIALREGVSIYAYATDGHGGYHFYHDANDLPLALAPAWGLIKPDNAAWRATFDFAFSEGNVGGCYGGRLGSVHTRSAWALGDVQDLILARLTNNAARAEKAWRYLRLAAQADGALPEAYDAVSGEVVSRHWFAWPSAALACEVLGAF